MERRVLLKKALDLLVEINDMMSEASGDPYEECPFCMGELFSKEDLKLIQDIKEHLAEE